MQLEQTVGVIMGSNIGTTLTAWLLSTAGIKSDNIAVSMLKPENFAPIVALIGIAMLMMSKKKKRQFIFRALPNGRNLFCVIMNQNGHSSFQMGYRPDETGYGQRKKVGWGGKRKCFFYLPD